MLLYLSFQSMFIICVTIAMLKRQITDRPYSGLHVRIFHIWWNRTFGTCSAIVNISNISVHVSWTKSKLLSQTLVKSVMSNALLLRSRFTKFCITYSNKDVEDDEKRFAAAVSSRHISITRYWPVKRSYSAQTTISCSVDLSQFQSVRRR